MLPDRQLIVHAGGINAERDLECMIRAIAIVAAREDVCFVAAGDGDESYIKSLEHLASELGIVSRVRFVGRLSPERARALMSESAIGVVTLQKNPLTELAWPTRIVELATLHKPLVVPRLEFIHRVLGEAALYYTPGNAKSLAVQLSILLQDPDLASSKGAAAAAKCRQFEWSNVRATLLKVYSIQNSISRKKPMRA